MLVPRLRFKEFTDEWNSYRIKDLFVIKNGLNKNKEYFGVGTPIINYMDINKNEILTKNKIKGKVTLSPKEINLFKVNKGDLFFARTSETSEEIGFTASLIEDIENCVYSGFLLKATPLKSNISPLFSGFYFRNPNMRIEIIKHSSITTRALTNGTLLYPMIVNIPSIDEQEKIGKLLILLNKKIELQSKKVNVLKLYKKGIKNKLLSNSNFEKHSLSEILEKWNIKNKNNKYNYVESISNKYGFISQEEQFSDRSVASKNRSNYYIVMNGIFAYNPSRLNVGSLALKKDNKISLISPLYECFKTNQNQDYLFEWFNSIEFKKGADSKFEGGVRNTLNFNNLCKINISLPSRDIQNKYADIFNFFNIKISFEEAKLIELIEFKKGLMQIMFV
jgi:type I restriction enzyme S subunit